MELRNLFSVFFFLGLPIVKSRSSFLCCERVGLVGSLGNLLLDCCFHEEAAGF
jgi:hypothetical protein